MLVRFLSLLCFYFISIQCIDLKGRINVSCIDVNELEHQDKYILNRNLPQSRFDIHLYVLDRKSSVESLRYALLDENFEFTFPGLKDGEYELILSSHDYVLENNRYHLNVDNETVYIYPVDIGKPRQHYNKVIYNNSNFIVNVRSEKNYYESGPNSIREMIKSSPLGFIFASKIYTSMFIFCLALSIGPFILKWANPELYDHLQEIRDSNSMPKEIQNVKKGTSKN